MNDTPPLAHCLFRLVLAAAVALQTMLAGAMMLRMDLARATAAPGGLAVICTPQGVKTLALPGQPDGKPQPFHGCQCPCAAVCGTCSGVAPAGVSVPVAYTGPRAGTPARLALQTPHVASPGDGPGAARAPPARSI